MDVNAQQQIVLPELSQVRSLGVQQPSYPANKQDAKDACRLHRSVVLANRERDSFREKGIPLTLP